MSPKSDPRDSLRLPNRAAPRQRTFRAALLLLVLGSLVLTVGAIGLVAFFSSLQTMNQLRHRQYAIMTEFMRREVQNLLGLAPPLLQSQAGLAAQNLLPVHDDQKLVSIFMEKLRVHPHLSWLSYAAAADGNFVGARRDPDDRILAHFSNPGIEEGRGREFALSAEGEWIPSPLKNPPVFAARKRDWFVQAAAAPGLVWSPVYNFFEGTPGLTASLALRDTHGGLRGVFTADYSLLSIDHFLDELARQRISYLAVFDAGGTLIGQGSSLPDDINNVTRTALEALGRPVADFARDERHPFRFSVEGQRMMGVAQRVEILPGFDSILLTAVGEREFLGPILDNALATVAIGAVALVISALLAFFIASRLGRPLTEISADLARISAFQLDRVEKPSYALAEISQLHQSVETMKTGLRAFGRYVPTQLVRRLLEKGRDAELGGDERELTILFSDLSNFTKISENLRPSEIVEEMREYFECATKAVEAEQGTLDKFLGDGVLAFFNAPLDVPDHAVRGCATALSLCRSLTAGQASRRSLNRPILEARVGLHTGVVLVGNIGTNDRFAYTVIGDSANLTARLESLNKLYGTSILASSATKAATGDRFLWRMVDRVAVKGRGADTLVFELRGELSSASSGDRAFVDQYEKALTLYFQGDFVAAAEAFATLEQQEPGDGPSRLMHERCRDLVAHPPSDWQGIFIAVDK